MTTPRRLLRRIVDHARRAPSIHNTQPWAWRIDGSELELWADRSRRLAMTDPGGRNLVLSCGTALQHAVVAAQALGEAARVEHLPDPDHPDLLARLSFTRAPYRDGDELYLRAIDERCTDRRRFTSWPVPEGRLVDLANHAKHWGAWAVPVTDAAVRFRVEMLVEDALRAQLDDERVVAEERTWVARGSGSSTTEGIPARAVPPLTGAFGERRSRFAAQEVVEPPSQRLGETTDGLLAVCTRGDDPVDWLHAGEALSALWLRATLTGLSLVPMSQVVEVPSTRRPLDELVLHGNGHAQILARIGWQEIGRRNLGRTPRRSLDDVLVREAAESHPARDQGPSGPVTVAPAAGADAATR